MSTHPYLRAYMAGVTLPAMALLLVMTAFSVLRFACDVAVPIERAIVFPMAVVPNAWGLWNMLYLRVHARSRYPLGLHGALLPLLLVPAGRVLAVLLLPSLSIPPFFPPTVAAVAAVVYYLLWKHAVGFFNRVLGVA